MSAQLDARRSAGGTERRAGPRRGGGGLCREPLLGLKREVFDSRCDVCRMRFFCSSELAKLKATPINANSGAVLAMALMPRHTREAGAIVRSKPAVLVVLLTRRFPQVANAVVRPIAVDVVNLSVRPFAVVQRPRKSVLANMPATEFDDPVALIVYVASSRDAASAEQVPGLRYVNELRSGLIKRGLEDSIYHLDLAIGARTFRLGSAGVSGVVCGRRTKKPRHRARASGDTLVRLPSFYSGVTSLSIASRTQRLVAVCVPRIDAHATNRRIATRFCEYGSKSVSRPSLRPAHAASLPCSQTTASRRSSRNRLTGMCRISAAFLSSA